MKKQPYFLQYVPTVTPVLRSRSRGAEINCLLEPEPKYELRIRLRLRLQLRLLSIYQSLEEILLKKIMVAKEFFVNVLTLSLSYGTYIGYGHTQFPLFRFLV
jgi:hypothetical protein